MESFDERKPNTQIMSMKDQKVFSDPNLKNSINKKSKLKLLNSIRKFFYDEELENTLKSKATIINRNEYHIKLSNTFDDYSPLMYLSQDQRKAFLEDIKFYKFDSTEILYSPTFPCENFAFILMDGEIHFLDHGKFLDLIVYTCFFEYDGPIFNCFEAFEANT